MKLPFLCLALTALLAGCGGGDADSGSALLCADCPPDAPGGGVTAGSVEGYWRGTSGAYEFGAAVLADGATYVTYARAGRVEGIMVGKTSADSRGFGGSVTDYNGALQAVTAGTFSGTYSRRATMNATAQIGNTRRAFAAAYDATYEGPVNLAELAGSWSGDAASRDGFAPANLEIGADGRFTGSTPLCSVAGALAAVQADKHPLRVTARFSGGGCPLAGRTVSGIAIASDSLGRRQLLAAGVVPDAPDGFFTLLTKR